MGAGYAALDFTLGGIETGTDFYQFFNPEEGQTAELSMDAEEALRKALTEGFNNANIAEIAGIAGDKFGTDYLKSRGWSDTMATAGGEVIQAIAEKLLEWIANTLFPGNKKIDPKDPEAMEDAINKRAREAEADNEGWGLGSTLAAVAGVIGAAASLAFVLAKASGMDLGGTLESLAEEAGEVKEIVGLGDGVSGGQTVADVKSPNTPTIDDEGTGRGVPS